MRLPIFSRSEFGWAVAALGLVAAKVMAGEIMVGDWVVEAEAGIINVFYRDFEIIRFDELTLNPDGANSAWRYNNNRANGKGTVRIEKSGNDKIIKLSDQEKGAADFRRTVTVSPGGVCVEGVISIQGRTGTNQYNRLTLFVPAETFPTQAPHCAVTSGGITNAVTFPPVPAARGLCYNVQALAWDCEGVSFCLRLFPPRAAAGARPILATGWSLTDHRPGIRGRPHLTLSFDMPALKPGDVIEAGYEVSAQPAARAGAQRAGGGVKK